MSGYQPTPSGEPRTPPAREVRLRRPLSPPESVLWSRLRAHRLAGLKFRRQHPLGPYVADFYCVAARLVIEVDGASHEHTIERDRCRDEWMRSQGLEVIRVSASSVSQSVSGVLRFILDAAERRIEADAQAGRDRPPDADGGGEAMQ